MVVAVVVVVVVVGVVVVVVEVVVVVVVVVVDVVDVVVVFVVVVVVVVVARVVDAFAMPDVESPPPERIFKTCPFLKRKKSIISYSSFRSRSPLSQRVP